MTSLTQSEKERLQLFFKEIAPKTRAYLVEGIRGATAYIDPKPPAIKSNVAGKSPLEIY